MQKFSKRLISLRKERNLTQEDVAKLINKKRSTVSGYETEGKEPDLETICFLANFFNVTTDYLLGYSDERTHHFKSIFYNDTINFEQHFKAMPEELRPVIAKCFNSFYLLLNQDMQLACSERLYLYQELLYSLQSFRTDILKNFEVSGSMVNPLAIADLMTIQSKLKNEISSLLDKLIQTDMEVAFNLKNNVDDKLSRKKVM